MKTNRYCPKCGEACEWDDRFCMHCRATLPPSTSGKRVTDSLDLSATELGLGAGQILSGRFEIRKVLGVGGMGRVYLAQDRVLERPVAVKVLRDVLSHDAGSVRRLVEEAKAAIRLAHPNIVRVDDYHDDGTVKFLAMEFVEGESLADLLGRESKLPEERARRIATEVCRGLEHAHANKVIHRDLKPGNILLRSDGAVKIADFGIARVARDSVSRLTSQQDSGTLLYMSPEQLLGKSGEGTDIYSLGIVLYEMLSGDPPFNSGDIPYQIREVEPPLLQAISASLATTVMRCLEKDPGKRFGSARELRRELEGTAAPREQVTELKCEEAPGAVSAPPPQLSDQAAPAVVPEARTKSSAERQTGPHPSSGRQVALKQAGLGAAGFGIAMAAGSFLISNTNREYAQLVLFASLILAGFLGPISLKLDRRAAFGTGLAFLLLGGMLFYMDLHQLEAEQASVFFLFLFVIAGGALGAFLGLRRWKEDSEHSHT